MKKSYILILCSIFLYSTSYAFKNRVSIGCGFFMKTVTTENERYIDAFPLPAISYTFLTTPSFTPFCHLGIETIAGNNPIKNFYSLSLNFKLYLYENYSGPLIRFSPLSQCNFGHLISEDPFLNYRLGVIGGYCFSSWNRFNFEVITLIDFPISDKNDFFNCNLDIRYSYRL